MFFAISCASFSWCFTCRTKRVINNIKQFCILLVGKTSELLLDACLICARANVQDKTANHDTLPSLQPPSLALQINLTNMPLMRNLKYLLLIVDKLSKWVEAFPCAKESASTATKI